MFCKTCGASLPDGAKFCTACGAPVIPEAPVLTPDPAPTKAEPILDMPEPTAPMYTPVAPEEPAYASPVYASADALVPSNVSDSVFNWGLAGLICSLFISILGIIFSAIAMGKAKRCLNDYGFLPQQAKTGRTLGIIGLVLETCADLQKNAAKKVNPRRFVDTGLYRIVRCPNYFGEMLFWTGVLVGGIPALHGAPQWIAALAGYVGLIYVMFSGARRLEMRQNRTYGDDPEYRKYVKTTPIMIPLIPLYSVEKYTWLVA